MSSISPSPAARARPTVTVGATLVVAGGVLLIVGSILNWFDLDGITFNGFTSGLETFTNVKGVLFGLVGAVVVGFGIVQLAAHRIVAIGVLGGTTSLVGLMVALKALSDVDNVVELGRFLGADISTGPGLYVAILGAIVALIGSVATVAKGTKVAKRPAWRDEPDQT